MDPHLADLKRRHKELEDEIADALRHRSTDDLMIGDLQAVAQRRVELSG
jgi:hypothetical protein